MDASQQKAKPQTRRVQAQSMSEMGDAPSASKDSPTFDTDDTGVTGSEIFSDMLRHMMSPLLIGMAFGAIWQLTVMPRIDTFVPNPVHGAFAMYLMASPLIYKVLIGMEMSRAGEYAMGLQPRHVAYPWFGCSEPHRSILLDSFQPLPGCSLVPSGYSLSFHRFDMASGTEWRSTLVPLAVVY